jgi:hypothetical protein
MTEANSTNKYLVKVQIYESIATTNLLLKIPYDKKQTFYVKLRIGKNYLFLN